MKVGDTNSVRADPGSKLGSLEVLNSDASSRSSRGQTGEMGVTCHCLICSQDICNETKIFKEQVIQIE